MVAKKKAFQPQLPFNADTPAVLRQKPDPKANVCQECALGVPFYSPCGKPAEAFVVFEGQPDPLPMCAMCADHNVRNRGGKSFPFAGEPPKPEPKLHGQWTQPNNIEETVDALGKLQAILAPLKAKEKNLKEALVEERWQLVKTKKLKADALCAFEGKLFRATVSEFEENRLDMDAVRAKLSPQFIRANTKTGIRTKVDVKARKDQQTTKEVTAKPRPLKT